jgi:hypothetical protein
VEKRDGAGVWRSLELFKSADLSFCIFLSLELTYGHGMLSKSFPATLMIMSCERAMCMFHAVFKSFVLFKILPTVCASEAAARDGARRIRD